MPGGHNQALCYNIGYIAIVIRIQWSEERQSISVILTAKYLPPPEYLQEAVELEDGPNFPRKSERLRRHHIRRNNHNHHNHLSPRRDFRNWTSQMTAGRRWSALLGTYLSTTTTMRAITIFVYSSVCLWKQTQQLSFSSATGRYSSSWREPHLRATGTSLAIWDHAVLPATRHK